MTAAAAAAVGGRLKLYGSTANQWEIHPQYKLAPLARGRSTEESSSFHNGSREASPWAFSSMGKQEQGQEVTSSPIHLYFLHSHFTILFWSFPNHTYIRVN